MYFKMIFLESKVLPSVSGVISREDARKCARKVRIAETSQHLGQTHKLRQLKEELLDVDSAAGVSLRAREPRLAWRLSTIVINYILLYLI
jgi:hypothetical protein